MISKFGPTGKIIHLRSSHVYYVNSSICHKRKTAEELQHSPHASPNFNVMPRRRRIHHDKLFQSTRYFCDLRQVFTYKCW